MKASWAMVVGLFVLAGCGSRALTQTECDAMTDWMRSCEGQAENEDMRGVIRSDIQGAERFCSENVGLEIDGETWSSAENYRTIGCSSTGNGLRVMREAARTAQE